MIHKSQEIFPGELGKVGVALQARLGSGRLPGKILKKLGGATVLEQCLIRLRLVPAHIHLVLTDHASYDMLMPVARNYSFLCEAGDGENVLSRYTRAAKKHNIQTIIRATADNPLVFTQTLAYQAQQFVQERGDYGILTGLPYGSGVEIVSAQGLFRAEERTTRDYDREHVCPYLYEHPEEFTLVRVPAPREFQGGKYRITLDTQADYEQLTALFTRFCFIPGDDYHTMRILHEAYS